MTLLSPLWLLISLLLLITAWLARGEAKQDSWHNVIAPRLLRLLRNKPTVALSLFPGFLLAAGLAAALSDPVSRSHQNQDAFAHAETWLAVVDISDSMNQPDINPTRLTAARRVLEQLGNAADARAVGLIVYAGDAFLAHPPTFDRQAMKDFGAVLNSGLIDLPGSNARRALALAQNIIAESPSHRTRIWLLTDSGGLDAQSVQIAQQLSDKGHRVDLILSALANSTEPEAINLELSKSVAKAGNGKLWQMDALGQLPQNPFDTTFLQAEQRATELALGAYKHWSHWGLLFLLPLVIFVMHRSRA